MPTQRCHCPLFSNVHGRTADCPAQPASADLDAQTVRILGRGVGFGRLMQLAEQEWRSVVGDGAELTVGPCAAMLVPCVCPDGAPCEWCCGTRRVTERVRRAIESEVAWTSTHRASPCSTSPCMQEVDRWRH